MAEIICIILTSLVLYLLNLVVSFFVFIRCQCYSIFQVLLRLIDTKFFLVKKFGALSIMSITIEIQMCVYIPATFEFEVEVNKPFCYFLYTLFQ